MDEFNQDMLARLQQSNSARHEIDLRQAWNRSMMKKYRECSYKAKSFVYLVAYNNRRRIEELQGINRII